MFMRTARHTANNSSFYINRISHNSFETQGCVIDQPIYKVVAYFIYKEIIVFLFVKIFEALLVILNG